MEPIEIIRALERAFPGKTLSSASERAFPWIEVRLESLEEVLSHCAQEPDLKFDVLDCMTLLDHEGSFLAIYHLQSTILLHQLHIKASAPKSAPKFPSVASIWKAAEMHEVEAAEMFGVEFEGHPGPRHLLLPDDWQGYPLRKDYVYPKEYAGIEHERSPLRKNHVKP